MPLGGAKQRAVLALLLLHANEVLPVDRLIDELWGESPPESAANMLQGYVSHLRKALEPGRGRGEYQILVSRPPGYSLQIRPQQLDATRFEALTEQARKLLDEGDAAAAAERLHAALALWRGPALADFAHEPFARPEADRLEEERLAAIEDRLDADLSLGRSDVVGELRKLIAEHPTRERLRGQLMLALYRSGRQAEALQVYQEAWRTFTDELGIEPGPALRELEQAILRHDPDLGTVAPPHRRVYARLRRRSTFVLAGGAFAAAAIAAALTLGGSAAPIVVKPHSVAAIDPRTNEVVADIPVGGYPGPITADDEFVYVCNIGDATVSIIRPGPRALKGTMGFSRAIDLVAAQGYLWAANGGSPGYTPEPPGTVSQHSAGVPVLRIRVGPSLVGPEEQTTIAADARRFEIWAGNQDSQTVRQVAPSSGGSIVRGIAPGGLAVKEGSGGATVWATDPSRHLVVRIDGASRRIVRRIGIPDQPTRLAAGDGAVWVTTRGRNPAVWRIDTKTNRPAARIPLPMKPTRVAVGEGAVWVAGTTKNNNGGLDSGGIVIRIDPVTDRIVARIPLGDAAIDGIVVSHGLVWVAVPPTV